MLIVGIQLFSAIFVIIIITAIIHLFLVIAQVLSLMNCAEKRFCEPKALYLFSRPVLFSGILNIPVYEHNIAIINFSTNKTKHRNYIFSAAPYQDMYISNTSNVSTFCNVSITSRMLLVAPFRL